MSKVFGVTGWKNSGKTTLVSELVKEFVKRGFTMSTIKHADSNFTIDIEGTDTFLHRQAGAQQVAIVSDKRWAIINETRSRGASPSLDTMLSKMTTCDLVIIEGFKTEPIPKIECIRAGLNDEAPIWQSNETVVAVAADELDDACYLPQFESDDIPAIADYIAQKTGLGL